MEPKQIVYITMDIQGALICVIAAAVLFMSRIWGKRGISLAFVELLTGAYVLGDAIAWAFRGIPGNTACTMVYLGNFLNFFASFAVMPVFFEYIFYSIEQTDPLPLGYEAFRKYIRLSVWIITAADIILLTVSQFTGWMYYIDADNLYHRGPYHWITSVSGLIQLIFALAVVIRWRKNLSALRMSALLCYILFPVIPVFVQTFIYGFSMATVTGIVCAVFMFAEAFIEQAVLNKENERLIKDSQIKIALSQIKPHFLFNTLSSIYYLVGMDSDRCREAISEFSEYLRGNISSIYSEAPIPVEQELQHTKAYLSLEKMRFPEKLKVEYDIREKSFRLPALTIQPLAENAVRHGIWKNGGAGTLTIGTYRADKGYTVVIRDDGAGFDPAGTEKAEEDNEEHIGLSNVRRRLEMMMGATLSVESTEGKGTEIRINVPDSR